MKQDIKLLKFMVDYGFQSWSGQTKVYKIGNCCFSYKHIALRSNKNKKLESG